MIKYTLEDVLEEMHSGGTPSTEIKEYWNGEIKWLSSGETNQDFIFDTIDKITPEGVRFSSTKIANKNDVVMACAGQGKTRGQVSYLLDDMYINQSVIALKANCKLLNSLYLYYNLKNRYNELRGGSDANSTRGSITTSALKKLVIYLPPLPTQQKIASILSAYDNLIQNYKKQIEALQTAASELYKEWFVRFRFPGWQTTKFENGIPEGWKLERIGEYCSIKIGGDVPEDNSETKNEKHKYPVFSNGINDDGLYGFTDTFKISEPSVTISARGTVGFVCLRREPYYPIVRLICLIPKKEIGVFYLFHSLKYADLDGNGTSQQQLTAPMVSKRRIIIADEYLIKRFNTNTELFYDKIDLLKLKVQNLTQQRDLLLPRLMSGKIKIK